MNLPGYLSQIGECETALELAMVVVRMVRQEPRLTKDEICKARFISLLPPLAPKVTDGITVDNLRIHIDNAVAIRKKAGNIR